MHARRDGQQQLGARSTRTRRRSRRPRPTRSCSASPTPAATSTPVARRSCSTAQHDVGDQPGDREQREPSDRRQRPLADQRRDLRLDRHHRLPGHLHAVHRKRRLYRRHQLRQRLRQRELHQVADDRLRQRHHHQRRHHDHRRPAALGTSPSGSQLLGLVANDFVRVYTRCRCGPARPAAAAASTAPPTPTSGSPVPNIYAAILAVNHSFIVDNYDCGSSLGTLTVWGAIAAAVPRPGRHVRRQRRRDRIPQELQLRRSARDTRAAVLPQPHLHRLVRLPRDGVQRLGLLAA